MSNKVRSSSDGIDCSGAAWKAPAVESGVQVTAAIPNTCTCCLGRGTKRVYFGKDLCEVPCPKCRRAEYEEKANAASRMERDSPAVT